MADFIHHTADLERALAFGRDARGMQERCGAAAPLGQQVVDFFAGA
jgi:hypothetical protein